MRAAEAGRDPSDAGEFSVRLEQTDPFKMFGKLQFDAEQDLSADNLILMCDTVIRFQMFGVIGAKLLLDAGDRCDRRA